MHLPDAHNKSQDIGLSPRTDDTDAEARIQPQQGIEIDIADDVAVEVGEVSEPNVEEYLLGTRVPCSRYSGSHCLLSIFKQRCAFPDNNDYIALNFDMKIGSLMGVHGAQEKDPAS